MKTPYQHENHKKPVTRRDFMAQTLGASVGGLLAPSALELLAGRALYGQSINCPAVSPSSMMPILVFDFAGGAPFAGQDFVVGSNGSQLNTLSSYENFGIPSAKFFGLATPNTELGLAFHAESPMLAGLNSQLNQVSNPQQLKNAIDGFVVGVTLNDDTSTNPIGLQYYPRVFGRTGLISHLIGTNAGSPIGSRHRHANGSEAFATTASAPVLDAASLRRLGGQLTLFNLLPRDKVLSIIQRIKSLSIERLNHFSQMNLSAQVRALVECGYIKASELPDDSVFGPERVFPMNGDSAADPNILLSFGNSPDGGSTGAHAAITRAVVNGHAGVGTLTFGGYDNHNGFAQPARNTAYAAGERMGRSLRYAHLTNSPLFIVITTDGGMGRNNTIDDDVDSAGFANYYGRPGDAGGYGVMAALAYIPNRTRGQLVVNANRRQIGSFTTQGVDVTYNFVARNPTQATQAVLLNYLALHGRENEISQITGTNNPFTGQMSQYKIFGQALG